MARHERICLTPRTLDRLYEVGSVDRSAPGCWSWAGGGQQWYPRVGRVKVMQIVCTLAYGEPEPGQRPLHSCDNTACVRVDHLRWGSQAENIQDAYDRKRGIGRQGVTV
jgi:hypothetical protein